MLHKCGKSVDFMWRTHIDFLHFTKTKSQGEFGSNIGYSQNFSATKSIFFQT